MRGFRVTAMAVVVLALAGCVPAQWQEGAVERSLQDLPAVETLESSSYDTRIGMQGGITVDVVLRAGSDPEAIADVVDAWSGSVPSDLNNALGLKFAGGGGGMNLFLGAGREQSGYRAATIEWATLVSRYPDAVGSISRADHSSIAIVDPRADAPGAVRAIVDEVRAAIAGVDTGAVWMISSSDDQWAEQGLEVLSESGLPAEEDLQHLESMGSVFASATELGGMHLFAQYKDAWTTVDVDLAPREFVNVRTSQIADQLAASAVWPVVTQFVDQVGEREEIELVLSTFGTAFAVLKTTDCERPAKERFPLDFEVWDYWASVRSICSS